MYVLCVCVYLCARMCVCVMCIFTKTPFHSETNYGLIRKQSLWKYLVIRVPPPHPAPSPHLPLHFLPRYLKTKTCWYQAGGDIGLQIGCCILKWHTFSTSRIYQQKKIYMEMITWQTPGILKAAREGGGKERWKDARGWEDVGGMRGCWRGDKKCREMCNRR